MRFIRKGIKIQEKKKKSNYQLYQFNFSKCAATILMGIKIVFQAYPLYQFGAKHLSNTPCLEKIRLRSYSNSLWGLSCLGRRVSTALCCAVLLCYCLLVSSLQHATKVGWLYDVLVVVKLKELLGLPFSLLSAYKTAISQ